MMNWKFKSILLIFTPYERSDQNKTIQYFSLCYPQLQNYWMNNWNVFFVETTLVFFLQKLPFNCKYCSNFSHFVTYFKLFGILFSQYLLHDMYTWRREGKFYPSWNISVNFHPLQERALHNFSFHEKYCNFYKKKSKWTLISKCSPTIESFLV